MMSTTQIMRVRSSIAVVTLAAAFLAQGCSESSEDSAPLGVTTVTMPIIAFGPVQGAIHTPPEAANYQYVIWREPETGSVSLDPVSGDFEYVPSSYRVGIDEFSVRFIDAAGQYGIASIRMERYSGIAQRPSNPSCIAPERPPSLTPVKAVSVFASIGQWDLISIYQFPAYPNVWYGIVKQGQIIRFENRDVVSSSSVVLDIRSRTVSDEESGLIGLVFDPQFEQNGKLYIYWTGLGSPTISYLSEFTSRDGGLTLDPSSERVLLSLDHTTTRHKGGHMEFGLDGYLYLGIGDGGPMERAQDVSNLYGTMIRIDPDGGDPYAIPPDNPFAQGGGRPEIFAWGLRNPWRWSFDRMTGDLWVADVGRTAWEEVNLLQLGGNYGWPIREGAHCHPSNVATCDTTGLIDPIFEYPHGDGVTAIIGGFVYRGSLIPELRGKYVFADISRLVQALESQGDGTFNAITLVDSGLSDRGIWSLSTDLDGEIYVVKPDGIFRLEPADDPAPTEPDFPETLSATGCFEQDNAAEPVDGMIPYDINVPFWSNGAVKERHFAIPDGSTIHVEANGDWTFPVGSVLAKSFYFDGNPVETRLFVRHDDGDWAGYAYKWRPDGTDADLLDGAFSLSEMGLAHTIPSRPQCLQCHVGAAGYSLGPEHAQMNRFIVYPDSTLLANQLATLEAIGMFDSDLSEDPGQIDRLSNTNDGGVSVTDRAKAYLHSNCSNCHRPNGPGRGPADFRYEVPHEQMGVCNESVTTDDFGIPGIALLVPGHPELSAINIRVGRLDLAAMPPIGKQAIDSDGVALLDEYVNSLTSCP